jgi:hypothetical protein
VSIAAEPPAAIGTNHAIAVRAYRSMVPWKAAGSIRRTQLPSNPMGNSVIEVLPSPAACGAPAVWSADGRVTVSSCIGCGRIDTAQQCAGTCGEHRMEIVAAAAHDRAVARLGAERRRADALRAVIDRLAAQGVVDDWGSAYRRLQAQARDALRALAAAAPGQPR